MFYNSKLRCSGQSQIIGVVLLTLVMITMVAVTYMWGMPLIEKQKDNVKISNSEVLMREIDKKIKNVLKNGGTQVIENPNIPGELILKDNGNNDTIEIKFDTTGTTIASGKDIYLIGDSRNNVNIGSESTVLKVFSEKFGDNVYEVRLSLYYRNVSGSENTYIVDLVGLGRESVQGKGHTLSFSEGGVIQQGNMYITKINARFE